MLCSRFLLAIYFTHCGVYMSIILSHSVPSSPSPSVLTCLFSMMCLCSFTVNRLIKYHFSRFHIYALIYYICFSLSDLLTSFYVKDSRSIHINRVNRRYVGLVAQSCLTLCDLMGYSPPGLLSIGILQERILEWVAMPFSKESSQPRD